ncbi:MAG: hypothetical protein QUS14_07205 [Pyrinomonadaceae bacterium]|nr:hypothetical protein [Pyrinomonadaceae bacterium]
MDDNAQYDRLRSIEMINRDRRRAAGHPLLDPRKGVYRRPGKEEIAALAVDESLRSANEAFLRQPNTGIVMLNAETKCAADSEVINASEDCLRFRMPGAGIAYSFRTESYRLPRLADLMFVEGSFRADAVLQQVIMVELGDLPLADVTFATPGMRYLLEFRPPPDGEGFLNYDRELAAGIEQDGFRYRKGFAAREQMTYALRSVAYKGNHIRTIEGVTYDELNFDKRKDVVIVFRIVDRNADGNVTILWKRLKESNAPTSKIKK